jgi:hypothetical protein
MTDAIPSLLTALLICLVASFFGEWCAQHFDRVPEKDGIAALILSGFGVSLLAVIAGVS